MIAQLPAWLALALEFLAILVAVGALLWRTIKQPLEDQTNGLGKRVTAVELVNKAHEARLAELDRALYDSRRDRTEMHEHIGRIEANLDRVVAAMEKNRNSQVEEDGSIRDRLTKIETKVDILLERKDHK